jgi:hypothetical protein
MHSLMGNGLQWIAHGGPGDPGREFWGCGVWHYSREIELVAAYRPSNCQRATLRDGAMQCVDEEDEIHSSSPMPGQRE